VTAEMLEPPPPPATPRLVRQPGLRLELLDVRRSSHGALEAVLDSELYVLAGTTVPAPALAALPAVYTGVTGSTSPGSSRWEVSYYSWTRVRRSLQARHVLLVQTTRPWLQAERLVVEAHVIRGCLELGGLHVLNQVTAAPGAWAALTPARRARALAQADAIVGVLRDLVFPGIAGGGLAASSGGGTRDRTIRHLTQRQLPSTDLDLAAMDRVRGLRLTATPHDSARVDLAHREARTGRPRVRHVKVQGRSYWAPQSMPEEQALLLAQQQASAADQVRAAVRRALR
jgi:hypothetical protein